MIDQHTNKKSDSMSNDANDINREILLELKKQNEKLNYLSDGLVDHSAKAAGELLAHSLFSFERRFPALITLLGCVGFAIIAILLYVIFIDNNLLDAYIH